MRRADSLPVTILLTMLVALGPISTDLYLPSLPSLMQYFSASEADVQLTLSVFLVDLATSQLIYGPLSDRFGIALIGSIILIALALAGVDTVMAIVVPTTIYLFGVGMVMANSMAGAIGPFPRAAGGVLFLAPLFARASRYSWHNGQARSAERLP